MPGHTPLVDSFIGRQVGSYVVEQLLGAGGMGSVYRGVQPAIGKRVAIKFLAPHLNGNPDVVARFFDEAKAVNVIGNENIVDIFDFGKTEAGQNYFVMELLDGPSLEKALEKQRAMSPARAVHVASQIAHALAQAHDRGIVHRDLKPNNVFLVKRAGREDFVKVLDFGIAKLDPPDGQVAGETDRRTKSGMILGTPGYMAPEQASGDPVDARADIYSLGVLLYRMLSGEVPFAAQSFTATLLRQLTETPKRLSQLRPDVPSRLDEMVMKMLARMPEERPQTMSGVADLLTAISIEPISNDVSWSPATPAGAEQRASLSRQPTSLETPLTHMDEKPIAHRRSGPPVGALLAIVGVALAVSLFFTVRHRVAADHPADAIAATVTPTPHPVPEVAAPTNPPAPVPPIPTPPTLGTFTLHVETTPAGAQIFVGDRLAGIAPADLHLDAVGPIVLKLPGFREERIEAHRDDGALRITLHKTHVTTLPRPPTGISLDD